MADKNRCVRGHLDCAKLSDVRECFSEVLGPVLRRMVAKDASKDHKLELVSLSWLQFIFRAHVHEADVVQIISYLTLKKRGQRI